MIVQRLIEPRQDRMEAFHRRLHIQRIPQKTELLPTIVKQQTQRNWLRLLQITHSQWIYRNISLHDKSNGYLRNKTAEDLAEEIHKLAKLQLEDVPTESMFLLEVDSGNLTKEHVETRAYWVVAVRAAMKAKAAQSARAASKKGQSKRRVLGKISSRFSL